MDDEIEEGMVEADPEVKRMELLLMEAKVI
jgi:hypothetical protein